MSVLLGRAATAAVRSPGDGEFERLYAEYAGRVQGYCRRQLGGRVEAEDATQTVFLHALRALRAGVVPETESAWIFTIAHNVCRTYWRGAARRRRAEDQRDPHVLEQVAAGHDPEHDELFGLDEALSRIPKTQRHAILLREWHGLSYREIAERLGTSGAAVEMLLFRARRSLAAELRGERPTVRAKVVGGLGDLLATLKLLLGGSSAAKIVAGAAVVAALTAGGAEVAHHETARQTRPAVADAAPAPTAPHAVRPAAKAGRAVRAARHAAAPSPARSHPALPPPRRDTPPSGAVANPSAALPATSEPAPVTSPRRPDAPAPDAGPEPAPSGPAASSESPPAPAPQPVLPETPELPVTAPALPQLPEAPPVPPVSVAPELPEVPGVPDLPSVQPVHVP